MADERHAAMCFIIYSFSLFNFDLNPESRNRVYKGIQTLRKTIKKEYPTWNDVTTSPNDFPENWMGLVKDQNVRDIMTEFDIFPKFFSNDAICYIKNN